MQITPVDQDNNLFAVTDVFPQTLVDQIISTDWLSLPWKRQQGQELWARRCIDNSALSWSHEWDQRCQHLWSVIGQEIGYKLSNYQGTAWWLDEPGFTCTMHTDGEMPGAMQMTWIGDKNLGTVFYYYKNSNSLRHQFVVSPNTGYIMINQLQPEGYRKLQWHDMPTPVPQNQFRVSSYSWLNYDN
jgi:hypothetical protein